MLKRLRTAHPILYCILSEVLFLGSMVVFSLLATIGLAAAGADFDTMDGYLFGSVQEAVGLAVALLLLSRTGRLDLLRRPGCCCAAPGGRDCWAAAAAAFGTVCWWGCTRCSSSGTQPLERWLLAVRTRRCCRCPAF